MFFFYSYCIYVYHRLQQFVILCCIPLDGSGDLETVRVKETMIAEVGLGVLETQVKVLLSRLQSCKYATTTTRVCTRMYMYMSTCKTAIVLNV